MVKKRFGKSVVAVSLFVFAVALMVIQPCAAAAPPT